MKQHFIMLLLLIWGGVSASAQKASIVNGDFSDGTNGWTIEFNPKSNNNANTVTSTHGYELWNASTYNIYQTLNDIPNGVYRVSVQGLYRGGEPGYDVWQNMKKAVLYANERSVPLKNIKEDVCDVKPSVGDWLSLVDITPTDNKENPGKTGFVPNDVTAANYAINTSGKYVNTIEVEVTNHTLTLGVKNEGENPWWNWTYIDNFKLEDLSDRTYLITNPTIVHNSNRQADMPNGWNTFGTFITNDNKVTTPNSDTQLEAYVKGNTAGNLQFDYFQTLKNLPVGYYELSADMFYTNYSENDLAGLYAYVHGTGAEVHASVDQAGNTFKNYSVRFYSDGGNVNIGAKKFNTGKTGYWFAIDNFTLRYLGETGDLANVKLTAGKYGTFVAPYAVTLPASVTVFNAEYNGNNAVELNTVSNNLSANTPVIIKGTEDLNINFYNATGSDIPTAGSILIGLLQDGVDVPAGSYVLQTKGDEQKFCYVASVAKGVKNRCYLCLEGNEARILGIVVDGEETAVENVFDVEPSDKMMYDLSGRMVKNVTTGLYIIGGKKVLVK